MISETSKSIENEFEKKWDENLEVLNVKFNELTGRALNLENNANNVEEIGRLFDRIYFYMTKVELPTGLSVDDKSKIFHFCVKNYMSIILLQLDDIMFLLNGRIVNNYRRVEILPDDIHPTQKNYWHKQFTPVQAEIDQPVELVRSCIDCFVQEIIELQAQLTTDWEAIEVVRNSSLTSEQLELSDAQCRALHTSPYFIKWLKDAKTQLKSTKLKIRVSETELSAWEVRIREWIHDLQETLKATICDSRHMSEKLQYKMPGSDRECKLTRATLDGYIAKSLKFFRLNIEKELLPDLQDVEFKFVAYAIEATSKVPKDSLQRRRQKIDEQRQLSKASRRKIVMSSPEGSPTGLKKKKKTKKRTVAEECFQNEASVSGSDSGDDEDDEDDVKRSKKPLSDNRIMMGDDDAQFSDGDGDGEEASVRSLQSTPSLSTVRSRTRSVGDEEEEEEDLLGYQLSSAKRKKKRKSSSTPSSGNKKQKKDKEEEVSFLNNDAMVLDVSNEDSYMTSVTYRGKNLMQALDPDTCDRDVADCLVNAIFESCLVTDIIDDIKHNIIREQNVVAFSNLKRRIHGLAPNQVLLFDFKTFFKNVEARALTHLRVKSVKKSVGGTGKLELYQINHNDKMYHRVQTSVNRIKLKVIFIYSSLNNELEKLDMSQFKRCGFLKVYRGEVKECSIPLDRNSLLEITGQQNFTEAEMKSFKEDTLGCKTTTIADLKKKEAEKKEKQMVKKEKKKETEKAATATSTSTTAASPTTVTAAVGGALSTRLGPIPALVDSEDEEAEDRVSTAAALASHTAGPVGSVPAAAKTSNAVYTSALLADRNTSRSNSIDFSAASSRSSSPAPNNHLSFASRSGSEASNSPSANAPAGSPSANAPADSPSALSVQAGSLPPSVKANSPLFASSSNALVSAPVIPAGPTSSDIQGGDDAKSVLKSVFNSSEGVNGHVKIVHCVPRAKDHKHTLGLVDLILFVVEHKDTHIHADLSGLVAAVLSELVLFEFYRSFEVDADGDPLAHNNTKGDGFCLVRSTKQGEMRAQDPTLTVARLKAIDNKTTPKDLASHVKTYLEVINYTNAEHTELVELKLEEILFNAEHFDDKPNPVTSWGDVSWTRFLKFDFAVIDFTNTNKLLCADKIRGKQRGWGNLQHLPFHYFQSFFAGSPPRLGVSQLRLVMSKSNYIGYSPGHFYILEHTPSDGQLLDGAVGNWIENLLPLVTSLTETQVENVRAYGSKLRDLLARKAVAPATTTQTVNSRGVVIDVDDETELPVRPFDENGKPQCPDNFFKAGIGAITEAEAKDMIRTIQFLKSRVGYLKERVIELQQDGQGKGSRKRKKNSPAAAVAPNSSVIDLSSEAEGGASSGQKKTAVTVDLVVQSSTDIRLESEASAKEQAAVVVGLEVPLSIPVESEVSAKEQAAVTVDLEVPLSIPVESEASAEEQQAAVDAFWSASRYRNTMSLSTSSSTGDELDCSEVNRLGVVEFNRLYGKGSLLSTKDSADVSASSESSSEFYVMAANVCLSWHSEEHKEERHEMCGRICENMNAVLGENANEEWRQNLTKVVEGIEAALYGAAVDLEDYLSTFTLQERLKEYVEKYRPSASPAAASSSKTSSSASPAAASQSVNEVSLLFSPSPQQQQQETGGVVVEEAVADSSSTAGTPAAGGKKGKGKVRAEKAKKVVASTVGTPPVGKGKAAGKTAAVTPAGERVGASGGGRQSKKT